MHATLPLLEKSDFPAIQRGRLETLQINIGYRCNQQCVHCHVNAGPRRAEEMQQETIRTVLEFLERTGNMMLDITGGAPELNPHFRDLVRGARALGVHVIDRCNLTILEEPDQGSLAQFLAENGVEIVASLPCYLRENVDRQRGKGVYDLSIHALRRLNDLGYGQDESGLQLKLVFNPQGMSLPSSQQVLEQDYKTYLLEHFGIRFNRLYTLTNMPIQRFGSMLISQGHFDEYMSQLRAAHQDSNLASVMCRNLISIDWEGYVYDCDFNQMLGLPINLGGKPRLHLSELMDTDLEGVQIVTADHCYGCTAGQGSSCGGALE